MTANLVVTGEARSWSRWVAVISCSLLFLLVVRDAGAECLNGTPSQSVMGGGGSLQSIMANSTAPCTLTVGPGTYTAASGDFRISSGITVQSTSGAGSTVLQVSGTVAVAVQAVGANCPSLATLDGFTLTGGLWGVLVQGPCTSGSLTGVTLRNLVINTNASTAGGAHGINFSNVQNSVIDSCTITSARVNGIYLSDGSHNNIVMNSTIGNTFAADGHAIALQGSNDNVVVANTITATTGSWFDGIILNSALGPSLSGSGSSRNRIERNTISGHRVDGIAMTDASGFNYVGLNSIVSSSYDPVSKPSPNPTVGVGIWVNNNSNGSYLFGNDLSGSPENGIDVLTSTSTYIQGNRVHANLQGGIWVANFPFAAAASSPVPRDIVIHGNYVYFNTQNAQINLQGVSDVDVAYNYLSGTPSPQSMTLAGTNTGGLLIHACSSATPCPGRVSASSSVNVYENTITDVNNRALIRGSTTNTQFFRNRFLNGSNSPVAGSGRQGLTYSFSPAGVQWDASRFLGGNHWSDFTAASGDPDPVHQYRGFVYDNTHGIDGNGPYVDKFPYSSEHLGAPYATYSVSMLEPVAGAALAAGTKKTIRWIARGCVLVDIYYASGALGPQLFAVNQPNTGHYVWTVPAQTFRNDYYVLVDCKDSGGSPVGVYDTSSLFTIAASDLVLLNPGRGFRAANGGPVRVAWKKSSSVPSVDIFVRSGSGVETQVGNNVVGTFTEITLPGSLSASSQFSIRIVDSGTAARQDSVDGYFMARGGSPTFTTALAGLTLQMGSILVLQWNGMEGIFTSYTVDLDLYENNSPARSIVKNLPDFGNYTWFVPEMWSANSKIHATFKDANGTVIGEIDSGAFEVFYSTNPGFLVNRYRLYSPVTLEHHFTTDLNEYNVLGTSPAWIQEGPASRMHNGPANTGGVEGVPYYRLYDFISRWHHWTTDRNEYFTLRQNTGRYVAEGVDGYIFTSQVGGTTPWYRLTLPSRPGLHHWTADQNERDTLVNQRGWIEEQREYVFPP